MAKLRVASAYRRIKRPYTRTSKFHKKAYIKGAPLSRVVMYDMGDLSRKFAYEVVMVAKKDINLRHNAIESGRTAAVRQLSTDLGKLGFAMKIRMVPHNIIREHSLATGAGADRLSTGMAHSYGKPSSRSAQIRAGKEMMSIFVDDEKGIKSAREAIRKSSAKFPIGCSVLIRKINA